MFLFLFAFHVCLEQINCSQIYFFSITTMVDRGLYFLMCTKFDQLILRKIIKIVATRCQILTLKCTKIDFGWGSAPDPAGELTALLQTP